MHANICVQKHGRADKTITLYKLNGVAKPTEKTDSYADKEKHAYKQIAFRIPACILRQKGGNK